MKIKTLLLTVSIVATTAVVAHSAVAKPETFQNPLTMTRECPDPYIMRAADGNYYGMCTQGKRISIWKAKKLQDVFTPTSETKEIWHAPETGWNRDRIWAPEMHNIQGKWYIYYTGEVQTGALECTGQDPMKDPWIDKGRIASPDKPDTGALDGTVLQLNGKLYFIWSGWDPDQSLFISEMSNPWTLTGHRLKISTPVYDWERKSGNINEGPAILKRNGRVFLVYSATVYNDRYYCLGMLEMSDKADPMDPKSWAKHIVPVFQASDENKIWSTGHNSFTTSPDGTEDWIVYHASFSPERNQPRYVCAQKFAWNKDGTPNFGIPVAPKTDIPAPSNKPAKKQNWNN